MKALELFCGFLLVVAVAQALPADSRSASDAKLERLEFDKDAEEIPVPNGPPAFDGFLGGISEMFERMRQQMLYLMSHVPRFGFATPEGGNTTSVTKVIDGHKVTINETVYTSDDGEDAAAVFKVRVVDIRPDSAEADEGDASVEPAAADVPKGSIESVELSKENEISKSQNKKRKVNNMDYLDRDLDKFPNLETFDDNNDLETFDETDSNNGLETFDNNRLESFDEDVDGSKESAENSIEKDSVVDLSNDIRVNKIAEVNGREPNPDAEYLPTFQPTRDMSRDIYINEIARRSDRQPDPNAEVFDPSTPYLRNKVYDSSRGAYVNEFANADVEFVEPTRDLSRDIYINEIARRSGRQPDPNAEVFDPSAPYLRNKVYDSSRGAYVNEFANPDVEFVEPTRDLSRDIYINEIARRSGRQPDPNAEVFDSPTAYLKNFENANDLSRDTYINEISNRPLNPDAEFINPFPRSRYYYRTDNS